jgi:hypothetical protein
MSEDRVPLLKDRTVSKPADAARIRPDIVARTTHHVDLKPNGRS